MKKHCKSCICYMDIVQKKQWRDDLDVAPLQDIVDNHVLYAMIKTNGTQTEAAKLLGINRNTLKRYLDRIEDGRKREG